MFMIARRQPPVKQNPQSFLHPRKIAENRRKTQKRCKFNLQMECRLDRQNDLEWLPLLPGCGTQHPHRALGGTRVLLAAAPTTPPCFRRWRRSSSLLAIFSGNNIYIFAFGATAFAERSAAMKAPVGLLSGRAVCVSRWRGFAPTSSAERSKRYFHGRGGVEGNGICSAAFCESAALRAGACSPGGSCRAATEGLLMEKRKKR